MNLWGGAILTEKGDGEAEVAQRIRSTTAIWRNLDDLWRHSRCTKKFKLQAYDATIKSKIKYGLETIPLTQGQKNRLNAFQLKGIRKILQVPSTYIDRTYSNDKLIQMADNIRAGRQEGEETDQDPPNQKKNRPAAKSR